MASTIAVGLQLPTTAPLALNRALVAWARLLRLDSCLVADHWQTFMPPALWDPQFTWLARYAPSPHAFFDYQVLLGSLAARAGRLRLGVGVTEPLRRHPILIAQAMLTLAHLTRRAPILGLGTGERLNITPYGLDFTARTARLAEAVQIIRRCFAGQSPIDFDGAHYQLRHAVLDLRAPRGKTPPIWIAAHGPHMLQMTGQYGDGWYPGLIRSPAEYAAKLAIIREAAQAAGRNPAAITPALWQPILVAATEREARALLDTLAGRSPALLVVPAAEWRQVGAAHPFGADYRGILDFLPEAYDQRTCVEGLAAVPPELRGYGYLWGTPAHVAGQLRALGDVGLRHVVVDLGAQMSVSPRACLYGMVAVQRIVRMVRQRP
jgi:phthiodiolone/phenolphthiodiolone dimycocerosates ketoreductase